MPMVKSCRHMNWMKGFLSGLLICFASLAMSAPSVPSPPVAVKDRPNIVFVLIDDAGFSDFGSYGGEIATPNIDQIASSGVRFTNFHTASTCEASRAMLHSGVDTRQQPLRTMP